MRYALVSALAFAAAFALPIAAGASERGYNTVETDARVTVYDVPQTGLSSRYYGDYYYYTSPYNSKTSFLHPYYRHTYYNYQPNSRPRITRPEFHKYLEDLYFNGEMGANLEPYQLTSERAPTSRCMNYRVQRTNSKVPPKFKGCF